MFCFISVAIPEVLGSQAAFAESAAPASASGLSDQESHNQRKTRGPIPHWHFETETPGHRNAIAAYGRGLRNTDLKIEQLH